MDTSSFQQAPNPFSNWDIPAGASQNPALDLNHWGLSHSPIGTIVRPKAAQREVQTIRGRNQEPPVAKSGCGCSSADKNQKRFISSDQSHEYPTELDMSSTNSIRQQVTNPKPVDARAFLSNTGKTVSGCGGEQKTISAASEHPCQSGGPCGCGGQCDGANAVNSDLKESEEILRLREGKTPITKEQYMEFTSATKAGNSSLMTCIMPSGEYLSAVAKVNKDLTIHLAVTELLTGETRLSADFIPLPNGAGWIAKSKNVDQQDVIIKYNPAFSLDTLTFSGLSTSIVVGMLKAKVETQQTTSVPFGSTSPENNRTLGNFVAKKSGKLGSNQAPCIGHDLVCTAGTGIQDNHWPWTNDRTHIQWWAPCVGSFYTDIGSCCFDHDIELWCSHSRLDWIGINLKAELCVMGKVIAQAFTNLDNEVNDLPWFLKWLGRLDEVICAPILAAWILGLDAILLPLVEELFLFGELLSRASNWNEDHSHDDSCLCGGMKQTVQCDPKDKYGPCADICRIAGKSENIPACYKCNWQCDTDWYGKVTRVFNTDPNGKLPCCLGTEHDPNDPTQGCNPLPTGPCPDCEVCYGGCWPKGQYAPCAPNAKFWGVPTGAPGTWAVCSTSGKQCCNPSIYQSKKFGPVGSPCKYGSGWYGPGPRYQQW
jgi:hypothetical protein